MMMKVGDLVTVRLNDDDSRMLSPGMIVSMYMGPDRMLYEVLSKGQTLVVTDLDIGPVDILLDKDRLEKRWND
jgi:hypothetical protein